MAEANQPDKQDQGQGAAPYLGVESSAKGFAWRDRLGSAERQLGLALSQIAGVPEILGRVMAARGASLETVDEWLNPTLKDLMPDPSILQQMDKGAERLAAAITNKEKVAIFGDYDVDGAVSSALVKIFLRAHDVEAEIYIPDRIFEGYGPNPDAINHLIDNGANLILTVDCGTVSHDSLAEATKRNIDVVVVDHHLAGEHLPDVCAIINPNRQDDLSNLGHLCAGGVVFMLLVAVKRALTKMGFYNKTGITPPDLMASLDLVALATICDVVPLKGLNRAFVLKGLQVMHRRQNPGLRALADAAGLTTAPTPYHLGFLLGPRINAGGRIGSSELGAKLLSETDESEALKTAALLDELNAERKEMEKQTLEEAVTRVGDDIDAEPDMPMIIIGSKDWHKGLVGLVASRLTEKFRRPSCVLAVDEKSGTATGSLRSIVGVDIGRVVQKASEQGLLVKGGGHAMAAGLTLETDKLEEVRQFFYSQIGAKVTATRAAMGLEIDGALTANGITPNFMDQLERAGPFGSGNPTPRFALPAHRVKFAKIVGEAHVKCTLEASDQSRINAIAFRAVGSPLGDLLLDRAGETLHIVGQLRRNQWNGRETIELTIEDAAKPSRAA
ncbi:MAG: single-stranded-DNA-specific exonuclease RecJ [Rhodomicrobium sp.]|nr:MAG: single-stranded-DNA-specific exonuclease RecJ [Rhodomicrobium sp.]